MSSATPESRTAAEKRADRRYQLWTGVVAGLAALIGAAVGGGVSYVTTKQTISAQAEQSKTDYLRSQRKEAYAELVGAEDTLSGEELLSIRQVFPLGLKPVDFLFDESDLGVYNDQELLQT